MGAVGELQLTQFSQLDPTQCPRIAGRLRVPTEPSAIIDRQHIVPLEGAVVPVQDHVGNVGHAFEIGFDPGFFQ